MIRYCILAYAYARTLRPTDRQTALKLYTTPLREWLNITTQCDTNRPSSSISRHITVDLYRTLSSAGVHSVDAV